MKYHDLLLPLFYRCFVYRKSLEDRQNEFERLRLVQLKDAKENHSLKLRLQEMTAANENERKLLEHQVSLRLFPIFTIVPAFNFKVNLIYFITGFTAYSFTSWTSSITERKDFSTATRTTRRVDTFSKQNRRARKGDKVAEESSR